MKRHITTMIAAAAISLIMAVPAMADWAQVSTNVWQWTENGVAVKDKWVTTQNGLYYINLDGNCSYGWINWCGNWYYGEPSGANLGNVVRNNWAQIDNSYYYFFEDGRMATGTQVIGGVTYTFDANGHCTTTPAGVNILTFSATPAVVSGGSSVYYGGGSGGSSSGGGSGETTTPPTELAKALKEKLEAAETNMQSAFPEGTVVNVGAASGNVVRVSVYGTRIDSSTKAADLFDAAAKAIAASGITDDQIDPEKGIEIMGGVLKASNISDMQAQVEDIVRDMDIATIEKTFGRSRNIRVNLNDGTSIVVHVGI